MSRPSGLVTIGQASAPSFDDPIAVLTGCHRRIESNLATLGRIVAALRAADATPEQQAEARAALAGPLRYFDRAAVLHAEDEDRSLFPRLREAGLVTNTDDLTDDHRAHEAMYLALRAVATRLAGGEANPAFVDELDLHLGALAGAYAAHIRHEEQALFPLASKLPDVQLRAIGLEMQVRRSE
jgi:hemerythrin-like domain-containing protein